MLNYGISCALRRGVALVGEFIYWALLTQSWENHFRCWMSTRRWNTSETLVVKKARSWLIFLLCKILDSDIVFVMKKRKEL